MTKQEERNARFARYDAALRAAHDAAKAAQAGMVEDRNALDCGFAWAVAHDPGFARWCRDMLKASTCARHPNGDTSHYGSKHSGTGWTFWKPGSAPVQSIGIHEAGARAFRDALAHGLQIRVELGSRLD